MDFDNLFEDMIAAMKSKIGESGAKAGTYLKQVMGKNKETIKELTEYYLNGDLTEAEYKEEMKDNMTTLENELLNLKIMKKKTIENVVNAGIDVLMNSIRIL